MPVGVIASARQRPAGPGRPHRSSAHRRQATQLRLDINGRSATEVHASDLTLDKFTDAATLAAAPNLPAPAPKCAPYPDRRHRLLGRYLALEWLDRMDLVNGKLICLGPRQIRRGSTPSPAGRDVR